MIVKRRGEGYVCGMCACVTWRHGGDGGHGDDGGDDDIYNFMHEIVKKVLT